MSIYEDPSFLKGEKDGDGITARSETPAEYIYVPGTAEEKALVRKIDFRMLPILWIMYVLNYMDRTNIGNARVGGLGDDLDITSTQYSVIVAAFFVTYIVFENPAAMILTRTRPSFFFPAIMFTWGGLTLAFLGVKSYGSIVALRVILGAIEAGFYPGVNWYITEWYPPREVGRRIAIFYSASILSSAFSGVLAGIVIESCEGVAGLRGWRWLFLIEGVVTMCVAICAVFIMPDWPKTSKFLKPEERLLAHARVVAHAPKEQGSTGHWAAFKLAVSDPKVWVIAIVYHFTATVGSIAYFAPVLTREMGYTGRSIQFMVAPMYVAGFVCSIIVAWSSDRFNDRAFHMAGCALVSALGFMIPLITLNNTARYIALVVGISGFVSLVPLWPAYLMSLICNDPLEKRAGAIAFISGFASIGALAGSFIWPTTDAPRFQTGFGYSVACALSMFFVMMGFHIGWGREVLRQNQIIKSKEIGGEVQGPVAVKI